MQQHLLAGRTAHPKGIRAHRRPTLPPEDVTTYRGIPVTTPTRTLLETDGWRYHRTPSRQARDNRRMQQHLLAGRTAVRFSHYEIRYEAKRGRGRAHRARPPPNLKP